MGGYNHKKIYNAILKRKRQLKREKAKLKNLV